ncbi:hypothetical protein BaRGS_00016852 [Batillaria attramentaria]|uniref:Uncharacterized protein n=1 Tax=Batillaria attramentaria TaxID=370345 RepID=A0ABD0KXF0_9CAEN
MHLASGTTGNGELQQYLITLNQRRHRLQQRTHRTLSELALKENDCLCRECLQNANLQFWDNVRMLRPENKQNTIDVAHIKRALMLKLTPLDKHGVLAKAIKH